MNSYDRAYDAWDGMTPSERKSWCKRNDIYCSDTEANHFADWLSENKYGFWVTVREALMEVLNW